MLQRILIYLLLLFLTCAYGSNIPYDRILSNEKVLNYLDQDNPDLKEILSARDAGNISESIDKLTNHLKEKISTRYYFDWNNFYQRFKYYAQAFPDAMKKHAKVADYQKATFSAKTSWKLPFKNLKIEQLIDEDYNIESGQYRDKHNSVFSVVKNGSHFYITLIKPISNKGLEPDKSPSRCLTGNQWLLMKSAPNIDTDASVILTNFNRFILVTATYFNHPKAAMKIDTPVTFVLDIGLDSAEITYLGRKTSNIMEWQKDKLLDQKKNDKLDPGEKITLRF